MAEKIARYYVADNNPDGGHFPGVGLRDLTEEEWDALPKGVRESVDASSMYRRTKPSGHVAAPAYESGVYSKKAKDATVPPVVEAVAVEATPEPEVATPETAPKEEGE